MMQIVRAFAFYWSWLPQEMFAYQIDDLYSYVDPYDSAIVGNPAITTINADRPITQLPPILPFPLLPLSPLLSP